ncbi:hypothetical protein ACFLY9_00295 [Patescibacteria group bacterium]
MRHTKYYRRYNTLRLAGYDYSKPGSYFVTINTKDMITYFGKVRNEEVILSPLGKLVKDNWLYIPTHFKFARLDTFEIMPNHIHGIISMGAINRSHTRTPTRAQTHGKGGITGKHNPIGKSTLGEVVR